MWIMAIQYSNQQPVQFPDSVPSHTVFIVVIGLQPVWHVWW
jgi:hypothetical protein